jgi:hypothetical protein
MNLIQQFPDVSMQIRNRVKWNKKSPQEKKMSKRNLNDNDPKVALSYDNQFKTWHYKLTLLIAVGIACLYGVILTASGIFQWIVIYRNSYTL